MRIKIKNLNIALKSLSSYELSLYVYITKRCDIKGLLRDVKMSSVKSVLGFSKQSFYNSLYALEEKGMIIIDHRKNTVGYDVLVTNNSFKSNKDASEPYLNMHYQFLETKEYINLPISMKRFILRAYTFINLKHWSITEDLLKKYGVSLQEVSKYFNISYYANMSNSNKIKLVFKSGFGFALTDSNRAFKSEYHRLQTLFNKWKVVYDNDSFESVVNLVVQYDRIPGIVCKAIIQSLEKDTLQPKLITSIITALRKKSKINSASLA